MPLLYLPGKSLSPESLQLFPTWGTGGGLFEPPQGYERGVIAKMFTGVENNETHIILIMFWTQVIVVLFNLIYCMCDLFPC